MTQFELREMIRQADWSDPKFERLAALLCDLWVAVEEDKRQHAMLPFCFKESDEMGTIVFCVNDLWRKWLFGASNDVDLVLSQLRALMK